MATHRKFEGFCASSQNIIFNKYYQILPNILVWNQGKIAIIKWVYFDVLKNVFYFGVFKSCM